MVGVQIPFMGKDEIARRVEELLDECWDGIFPIKVEAICDYLKISIVPVGGLVEKFKVEAFMASDFKTVYVDQLGFINESSRYRFSLAHELGHYILHREYYPRRVESVEDWSEMSEMITNSYAEYQANYFAGSLLVPETELVEILNTTYDGSFIRNCWSKSRREFRDTLRKMRKVFNISEQVVARRMQDIFLGVDGLDEIAIVLRRG